MRYQEGAYGASDGFMDRLTRMGQEAMPYGRETAPRRMDDEYGGMAQGGDFGGPAMGPMNPAMNMGPELARRQAMPQQMQQAMPQQMQQAMPQPMPQMMTGAAEAEALNGLIGQLRTQMEDMRAVYEKNAACVDEIREIIDAEDRRIRLMLEQANQAAEAVKNAPAQQEAAAVSADAASASLDKIRELLDARAEEDRKIHDQEKTEREARHEERERRAEERANLENARREADARRHEELEQTIAGLQSEFNRFGIQMDNVTQSINAVADMSGLAEKLSERADVTDKNTHDVGVRIYRNVQAAMNDYLAKQTSTLDTTITGLNQRIEAMEDTILHRRNAMTPITIAALVTGLVNLGVLVLYILSHF